MKNKNSNDNIWTISEIVALPVVGIWLAVEELKFDHDIKTIADLFSADMFVTCLVFIFCGIAIFSVFTGIIVLIVYLLQKILKKFTDIIGNRNIAELIFIGILFALIFYGTALYLNWDIIFHKTNTIEESQSSKEIIELPNSTATPENPFEDIPSPKAHQKFLVTMYDATLDYNNNVGENWSVAAYVNDQVIDPDGVILYTSEDDQVDISAECTEWDDIIDIGKASTYVVIEKSDFEDGFLIDIPVTVTENRGRYSGNTAKWTVTLNFEPTR